MVERLDTSELHRGRRRGGAGRAGYDPDMLLALLVYAYCTKVRSSRQIERLCETDVAYRVICANRAPDHTTIARFRQEHAPLAARLFVGRVGDLRRGRVGPGGGGGGGWDQDRR